MQITKDEASPRSGILQALVHHLQLDPEAREAGRRDGARRERWQPGDHEILAYASGYHEGQRGPKPDGA